MSDVKRWSTLALMGPEFMDNLQSGIVFGNSGSEALLLTKDDEVFCIGTNTSSCLGIGSLQPGTLEPLKVGSLCGRGIETFAFGTGPHVLALNRTGELYAWGHNGVGNTNPGLAPQLIGGPLDGQRCVQIACGSYHSVAVTDRGEMLCWGMNACGQLGIGSNVNQHSPRRVVGHLQNRFVKSVACGQNSTMAMTASGEVFAWGFNGNGQLGVGNTSNQHSPFRVLDLQNVVINQIVGGFAHSLALSDEGQVFAWGSNSCGQLGGHLPKTNQLSPVTVAGDLGRIIEIAAIHSSNMTVVVNQAGKVYMWGQVRGGHTVAVPIETRFNCSDDAFACFASPPVSWRPIEFGIDRRPSILEAIRVAFDDPTTADLHISIDGRIIHAHKALLKMRCQYFRSRFRELWSESNGSNVAISQFTYPVYRSFLAWLYTDELAIEPEDAIGLLDLANCYCELGLKDRCAGIIRKGITVDNAALLYAAALRFDVHDLEEFCFQFCLNHMTAVTQSDAFARLDEHSLKSFIVSAAKNGAFKN